MVGRIATETDGQDLIEYGLLASLVSVAAAGALSTFGISVLGLWNRIFTDLSRWF